MTLTNKEYCAIDQFMRAFEQANILEENPELKDPYFGLHWVMDRYARYGNTAFSKYVAACRNLDLDLPRVTVSVEDINHDK